MLLLQCLLQFALIRDNSKIGLTKESQQDALSKTSFLKILYVESLRTLKEICFFNRNSKFFEFSQNLVILYFTSSYDLDTKD